jgi:hypothetical protein
MVCLGLRPGPHSKSTPGMRGSVAKWIRGGETIRVAGRTIPRGFFYFGGEIGVCTGILDETVPVELSPDTSTEDLLNGNQYYRSYQELTPLARRAYIDWLASDRSHASSPMAFVFLYLYGLELRLLLDGAQDEEPALVEEVKRLLVSFGHNRRLAAHVDEMLFALSLRTGDVPTTPDFPALALARNFGFRVRLILGAALHADGALDADCALAWLLVNRQQTRITQERYFPEFLEHFRRLFGEVFPNGLKLIRPKATLPPYVFHAGSALFDLEIGGRYRSWPDVLGYRPSQLAALGRLHNACFQQKQTTQVRLLRAAFDVERGLN